MALTAQLELSSYKNLSTRVDLRVYYLYNMCQWLVFLTSQPMSQSTVRVYSAMFFPKTLNLAWIFTSSVLFLITSTAHFTQYGQAFGKSHYSQPNIANTLHYCRLLCTVAAQADKCWRVTLIYVAPYYYHFSYLFFF